MYVTYSDLFAFTTVLIGVATFVLTLCAYINKKK